MHQDTETYVNLAIDGAITLAWLGLAVVCVRRSFDTGWAWLGRIGGFLAFVGTGAGFAARAQVILLHHHSIRDVLVQNHVSTYVHVVLMVGVLTIAAGYLSERA